MHVTNKIWIIFTFLPRGLWYKQGALPLEWDFHNGRSPRKNTKGWFCHFRYFSICYILVVNAFFLLLFVFKHVLACYILAKSAFSLICILFWPKTKLTRVNFLSVNMLICPFRPAAMAMCSTLNTCCSMELTWAPRMHLETLLCMCVLSTTRYHILNLCVSLCVNCSIYILVLLGIILCISV